MKSIIFSIAGIAMLIGAALSALSTRRFVQEAARAPGLVYATPFGGSHPQIEFVTRSGQKEQFPQGGWIGGYKVGDRVTVLYRPEDPRIGASIDAVGALWDGPIFLFPMGLFFCLAGIFGNRFSD